MSALHKAIFLYICCMGDLDLIICTNTTDRKDPFCYKETEESLCPPQCSLGKYHILWLNIQVPLSSMFNAGKGVSLRRPHHFKCYFKQIFLFLLIPNVEIFINWWEPVPFKSSTPVKIPQYLFWILVDNKKQWTINIVTICWDTISNIHFLNGSTRKRDPIVNCHNARSKGPISN